MPWRRSGQALTTSPVSGLPTPQSSRRAATPCPSRLPTGNDSLQRPRGAQSGSRAQPAQQAAGRPGARLRPAARRRPEEPALAGQPGRAAPQPTAPAPTRRPAPCPPRPSHLEGRPLRLSRVPAGRPGHSRRAVSRGGSWTRQSGLACDRRRRPRVSRKAAAPTPFRGLKPAIGRRKDPPSQSRSRHSSLPGRVA